MIAPTRALIVEDHDHWVDLLSKAARRAGASEVITCKNLEEVREALRKTRFDVALLDIGLDPDDDLNSDGIKALEQIRAMDGPSTRCVLVSGWQGGDRMTVLSEAQRKHDTDWGCMKEQYEARKLIAKLTELLEQAATLRLSQTTPMQNLGAGGTQVNPLRFERELLDALSPSLGVQTLYTLTAQLLKSAIPLIAMDPAAPMRRGQGGSCTGLYWSRALGTPVAVGLAPAGAWPDDESIVPGDLARLLPADVQPDVIETVPERNVVGRLWELTGLGRDKFPG